MPVVGAASVFGLLALPVAAAGAWLMRLPIATGHPGAMLIAGLGFWLACFSVSSTIGMLFKIITPNAMTHENLVGIPLVLLSGVFGTPAWLPSIVIAIARILPTRQAVQVLTDVASGYPINWAAVAEVAAGSAVWLTAAALIAGVVAKRATVTGTLEVV
jgi:ABC-2 type transport system permease protein